MVRHDHLAFALLLAILPYSAYSQPIKGLPDTGPELLRQVYDTTLSEHRRKQALRELAAEKGEAALPLLERFIETGVPGTVGQVLEGVAASLVARQGSDPERRVKALLRLLQLDNERAQIAAAAGIASGLQDPGPEFVAACQRLDTGTVLLREFSGWEGEATGSSCRFKELAFRAISGLLVSNPNHDFPGKRELIQFLIDSLKGIEGVEEAALRASTRLKYLGGIEIDLARAATHHRNPIVRAEVLHVIGERILLSKSASPLFTHSVATSLTSSSTVVAAEAAVVAKATAIHCSWKGCFVALADATRAIDPNARNTARLLLELEFGPLGKFGALAFALRAETLSLLAALTAFCVFGKTAGKRHQRLYKVAAVALACLILCVFWQATQGGWLDETWPERVHIVSPRIASVLTLAAPFLLLWLGALAIQSRYPGPYEPAYLHPATDGADG